MRILHIDKFLDRSLPGSGGVGSVLRRLGRLQEEAGHQVLYFGCTNENGPAEMPRYFDFTATRNPLAIVRMVHNGEARRKLESFLDRFPADVAHLHNIYHHLTPSILPALARRGMGIVMTMHDYRLACPAKHFLRPSGVCTRCVPNRLYHAASPACAGLGGVGLAIETFLQRFFRRYSRWVDYFLCPSAFMRDMLVRSGMPPYKAVLVRNIVEPLTLPPGAATRDEFLFAGRLSEEKSPQLMLELAAGLPRARVTIAGDGPLREPLRQQVALMGLTNVDLPGQVDHDALGGQLARAAAVVIASRCFENSPQVMLEAMACGKCVIAPDHPPIREWIQDGATGRLFPPGDANALRRAAAETLADEPGRARMGQAARQLVLRRHDPQTLCGQIMSLYEESIRRCALR